MDFWESMMNIASLGDDFAGMFGAPPDASAAPFQAPGTLPNLEQFVGNVGGGSGAMIREPFGAGVEGRAGSAYPAEFRSADSIRKDIARTFLKGVTGRDPRSATNRVRLSDGTLVDVDQKTGNVSAIARADAFRVASMTPGRALGSSAGTGLTGPGAAPPTGIQTIGDIPQGATPMAGAFITNRGAEKPTLTAAQIAEAQQTYTARTKKLEQLTPTTLRLLEDASQTGGTPQQIQQALADRMQLIQTFGPETIALRLAASGTGPDRNQKLATLLLKDQEKQTDMAERAKYQSQNREDVQAFQAQQREDQQAFQKEQLAATLGERAGKEQRKSLLDRLDDWNREQKNIIRVKQKDDPDQQAALFDAQESTYLDFRRNVEAGTVTPGMTQALRLTEPAAAAPVKPAVNPATEPGGTTPAPAVRRTRQDPIGFISELAGTNAQQTVTRLLDLSVRDLKSGRSRSLGQTDFKTLTDMLTNNIGSGTFSRDTRHDLLDALREKIRNMLPRGLRKYEGPSGLVSPGGELLSGKRSDVSFDPDVLVESTLDALVREAMKRQNKGASATRR